MKMRLLTVFAFFLLLASCSTAYKQGQTPDDVYYSPERELNYARADRYQDRYDRNNNNEYDEYTSSSDDRYLRMKIQNRYRWNQLDDYDYWSSPGFAFNNYYGYNSFNPFLFNNWGLNYSYSPFATIQPFGWFNSFYPSYGYYRPLGGFGGYYGHFGNGYMYGYAPVYNMVAANTTRRNNVYRPMLGTYTNGTNGFNNSNSRRSLTNGRYIPANTTGYGRYNNRNSNTFGNNNTLNRNNNSSFDNSRNSSAPVRSYTPSSSSQGSNSGGVRRQGKQ